MIVERDVNEYADLVADALDAGRPIGMADAVALAQEIVRLQKDVQHLEREIDYLRTGEEDTAR